MTPNIRRLEKIVNNIKKKDGIPLPSVIEVTLVDACNRRCALCPRSNDQQAPNNHLLMDMSLIRRLRTDLGSLRFNGIVVFSGFGEPTLFPHLIDAIETLSEVARVDVVTNGDSLNIQRLNEMYGAGLNHLLVSLYDKKRFAPIQSMMSGYEPERYELRKRWDDIDLKTNRGGTLNQTCHEGPCYYPAYTMMIDWNGDVCLCPHDWNRRVHFGNIAFQSIWSIWTSEYFKQFRKSLFSGRTLYPCRNCDAIGTVHGKKQVETWRKL